jgi:hypothetical protein
MREARYAGTKTFARDVHGWGDWTGFTGFIRLHPDSARRLFGLLRLKLQFVICPVNPEKSCQSCP